MDIAELSAGHILTGTADVAQAREANRRRRTRRLLFALVTTGVIVYGLGSALASVDLSGLTSYIPAAILIILLALAMFMPFIGAGRSPHVLYRASEIDTTLADVRGADILKEEVVRTLNLFLAYRTFKEKMGGTPRRGVLFEGPPGTGKTYIAKAMAKEAGVPFLYVSSSAFQSMYYGQTNRKIRSFFKALRKYARQEGGAIGFIEEIDAIGASRSGMGGGSMKEGITGVVNELLIQLQSFDTPTLSAKVNGWFVDRVNSWLPASHQLKKPSIVAPNILVVGATNRAADLDPALLRPGRFDRTIRFDLPSRSAREDIIAYYLSKKSHDTELDEAKKRDILAAMTSGYSPVMLEHLFDEALVWALRRGADRLSWNDIQQAKMTVELGLKQPVEYTDAERRTIATHEAGHAVVCHLVGHARKLEVLSIIKRGDALGLLAHSDVEERWTNTKSEQIALIKISFGGMVAEELFFGESGTGPGGDLKAATETAIGMVGGYGMGPTLVSFAAISRDGIGPSVMGDKPARAAVESILESAKEEVTELLSQNRHLVEALRDALLVEYELVDEEILSILSWAQALHEAGLPVTAPLPKETSYPEEHRTLVAAALPTLEIATAAPVKVLADEEEDEG